jgi:hypothetical protein
MYAEYQGEDELVFEEQLKHGSLEMIHMRPWFLILKKL